MKLVLLQPPVQDFYDTELRLLPLGLGYLKAAVREHLPETEVVVRDFRQGRGRRTVPLPRELAHLRAYYPFADRSPFSTFHGYYHFGAPFDELAEEIAEDRPDVVGISSLFSAYHREVLRCAEVVKERLQVPVVIGGGHASAAPRSLLRNPAVDYVIRGEGERPLVELLRNLWTGGDLGRVPNLGFRREGEVILTPREENFPLTALPAPDLSDLAPGRYRLGKKPLATLVSSRGCVHRCSFCAVRATFGPGYRRRAAADVVAELRTRWDEGYRAFDFEDDNLTADEEAAKELFRAILREFGEGALAFHAMNGVSWTALDRELLGLMARAGFTQLNLSLVSRDPRVRERAGRPHSLRGFREVVEMATALGLRVVAYQILGLPGEDPESTAWTLAYLGRLPVLVGASPFYLAPGSPLAEGSPEPGEAALVTARLTALGADPEPAARDAVYTLLVTARILNFLKALPVDGEVVPLSGALAGAREAGGRVALGAELLEHLLTGGILFGATGQGLRPLYRFRPEIFQAVWSRLGRVETLGGGRITLG